MMPDQEQLSYCHYVYQFMQVRRYQGMMPEHLVRACDEKKLDELFERGLLAFLEARLESGRRLRGVVLTDKGLALLQGVQAEGRGVSPRS